MQNFTKANELIEIGFRETEEIIPEILSKLERASG
jgi:hypothetical protein